MKKSSNPDFLIRARSTLTDYVDELFESLSSFYLQKVLPLSSSLSSNPKMHYDASKRLKSVLNFMEYDQVGLHRPLFHPVTYINQHTSLLRHIGNSKEAASLSPISDRDVYRTIRSLADVIVHLGLMMKIVENLDTTSVLKAAVAFYDAYYKLATEFRISPLPRREDFSQSKGSQEETQNLILKVSAPLKAFDSSPSLFLSKTSSSSSSPSPSKEDSSSLVSSSHFANSEVQSSDTKAPSSQPPTNSNSSLYLSKIPVASSPDYIPPLFASPQTPPYLPPQFASPDVSPSHQYVPLQFLPPQPQTPPLLFTPSLYPQLSSQPQPKVEDSLGKEGPPQNMSTEWYKKNGFSSFIRSRKVIPQGGALCGRHCIIEKFNGNNSLFRVLDDNTVKYVSAHIPLIWE